MWYGGRLFRPVATEGRSQTTADTVFKYEQITTLVMVTYSGGAIRYGQMIGQVLEDHSLDMRYQHMDRNGLIKTGICKTVPEVLDGGRLRLHETWQWTCDDRSTGTSVLEEI